MIKKIARDYVEAGSAIVTLSGLDAWLRDAEVDDDRWW
jgi:hypothetical protein